MPVAMVLLGDPAQGWQPVVGLFIEVAHMSAPMQESLHSSWQSLLGVAHFFLSGVEVGLQLCLEVTCLAPSSRVVAQWS